MSRWKKKKRKWLLQHARALNQKKQRRSQTVYGNSPGSSTQRFYSRDERPVVIQTPPRNFSLINNPEETMSFFADFAKEINRNQSKTHFIVDSRNVESVTVDSLIYLIAILQNEKQNRHIFIFPPPCIRSKRRDRRGGNAQSRPQGRRRRSAARSL